MPEEKQSTMDITMLVCTFNRCGELRELLETALAQETGGLFSYEVLVVDNNSTDDTRRVVESLIAGGQNNLRYLFEGRQGRSNALNTGLDAVRGAIYALADDDLMLPKDYLMKIFTAFQSHPEVSFVGGKVLPLWKSDVPAWLTQQHWSAIAMSDYGEREFYSDSGNQINLLAGAFRVADVKAVGGYHRELGVSKGTTGGTEDAELHTRLWRAERKGLYLPHLWLHHKVEPQRVTKEYHRRWHTGHGRHYAIMRDADIERAAARLFDVPAHLYRQAAISGAHWLRDALSGKLDAAFLHETQLRFFLGFFRERYKNFMGRSGPAGQQQKRSALGEVTRFARSLVAGKATRYNENGAGRGSSPEVD
ncbi:MAG: glycosyltransferase family 2 protein [Acidobacteriota bacterium]|nr:glycosyltransferase family 2 protein [Acidobacteriota bacterium]